MNGPMPVAVTAAPEADFAEIAVALLVSLQAVRKRAIKESWPYREQPQRGGKKRLFPLASLPPEVRQTVQQRRIGTLIAVPPALTLPVSSSPAPSLAGALPAASPSPTPAGLFIPQSADLLTDRQRAERDARAGVVAAIRSFQAEAGCGLERALHTLLATAASGRAAPVVVRFLQLARDGRGRKGAHDTGLPSIRTLKRWLAAPDLAPKVARRDMSVPPWACALMKLYGRPQKPSLSACMEELPGALPAGVVAPSYHAARRFLDKLGAVSRQAGRMLPRELKAMKPFIRRDTAHLLPGDYYTADGHTFDAEIAHPDHGRAFRPEITSVIDIATRKCVGWSAGLAESTWTVMDAQRNAFETHGVCAGWYVDRGAGFRNAMQSDEVAGFAARVGFQIHHSLPYNSQARGIEERSHRSLWVRAAKTLPTYMGADMDPEAKQKVFKLTRRHIKETGGSRLLMPWERFTGWCQAVVDAYNARPHRGLPKIRDPQTGKMRHSSPDEAWAAAIDGGWAPMMLTDGEKADLFRPEKVCKVQRCEIRFRNNLYFSRELEEFDGDHVRVGYDIHDAFRVWVRDTEGRLICIAEFAANRRAYFPQSVVDQDRQKRAAGRERRLKTALQEVRDELAPPALLSQAVAESLDVTPRLLSAIEGEARRGREKSDVAAVKKSLEAAGVTVMPGIEVRPWFRVDPDQYRWLARHPQLWDGQDAAWLLDYVAGEEYADLSVRFEHDGLGWTEQDEARARAVLERFEAAAR
ncbi:MAG: transposase family protein [Rhodocyclaceae bacterium]|nr:transposase family protein [Rhodocyclaceae bacterium]